MNSRQVYELTKKIPRGKVTTYGEIARALGNSGYSRAVGNALNKNVSKDVPCHRVVRSDGKVGGFRRGTRKKIEILRNEGIFIENGKISNLSKFLHKFR